MRRLSKILASDMIAELSINSFFDELTDGAQKEIVNLVQQVICDYYNRKDKTIYLSNPQADGFYGNLASLALTIKKQLVSIIGVTTRPVYTGTLALTIKKQVIRINAGDDVIGDLTLTIKKQLVSITGVTTRPVYTGTLALTIKKQTVGIGGTFTVEPPPPEYSGSLALTIKKQLVSIVGAYTAPIPAYLNISSYGGGTVSPSSGYKAEGINIPIHAYPSTGYTFLQWYQYNGAHVANLSSASTTVTLTGNGEVGAYFTEGEPPPSPPEYTGTLALTIKKQTVSITGTFTE